MQIYLQNSLSGRLDEFIPIDENNVRMYACGPTVYDTPHIGNARPLVVFDVLYRLLMKCYKSVTYVRNITDVDDKIIKKAIEERKTRNRHRGASTISQQTAKNVFLWPKSSWVRKGFEVYFTFLIEKIWGKERIMEVYLNSIEMGASIYGVEACARAHFQTTASRLNEEQCALIAASLPNPIRFNSAKPSPYMIKRKGQIIRLMHLVPPFPVVQKSEHTK